MIKVCGMREPDNIRAVEQLGIDWMGFIFAPKSSRYVSERPSYLPERARRVGVFVDSPANEVMQHVRDYRLDLVQLHGHETPDYLRQLREAGASRIIKAISIATAADLAQATPYHGLADYLLFDTKALLPGGNGIQFDWSVLTEYHGPTPFLLSGGIGPDDARRILSFRHPRMAGIDLNSRFEQAPALKDTQALARFLTEITPTEHYNPLFHHE